MKEKLNILIIDDDDAIRFLTKHSLRNYASSVQLNIYEAINGEDAIKILTTLSLIPDVILLDINMPYMDGYVFLEVFAQLPIATTLPPPYIYVLSTVTQALPDASQKLVKGHFEKPLTEDHIQRIFTAL